MSDVPARPRGHRRRQLSMVVAGVCAAVLVVLGMVLPGNANAATQVCSNKYVTSGGNYYQLWSNSQGTACMTVNSAKSYTAKWSNVGDIVLGVGWNPGSTSRSLTYSSSMTSTGGTTLLSLYGWTSNPRVEYYVIENYKNPNRSGTSKGTVTTNGGTYDLILNHTSSGTPQYLAIRRTPRTSGTITFSNIVKAWSSHGLKLGTMGYQMMATEAWGGGNGSASLTIS